MQVWALYAVGALYLEQAVACWLKQQWAMGFLVFMYALACIPLIFMNRA